MIMGQNHIYDNKVNILKVQEIKNKCYRIFLKQKWDQDVKQVNNAILMML